MMTNKTQQPPFYYVVVVWGNEYVDMLLQVSLRCFLSPKNIPSLSNLEQSKFIFVTTPTDYARISASPIFEKLKQYLEPVFIEIDMSPDENIYTRMTLGYELATKMACKDKAYAIYLLPDCIVSDGTFSRLEHYAKEGRDVVLLPGPRIVKEKFMSFVHDMALKEDDPLTFEPRKLVAIGLPWLHDEFKNYNYTEESFTKTPHMVTWNISKEKGLLVRAFHLHPIMVNCSNREEPISFNKFDTIDGSFIQRNFTDLNRFLWERDSDNMILYSMTNEDERAEDGLLCTINEKQKAIIEISQSALVNELQKINFYNAYRFHVEDITASWQRVEKESLSIVNTVLTAAARPKSLFYLKVRKRLLDALPANLRVRLKQTYWKTRGAISWCKARIAD